MQLSGYYDTTDDIIVVRPVGYVTTDNIRASMQKALELSRQHTCIYLLFDIRACEEGQSMIRGFEAMQDMQKSTGISIEHRCAVVYDPEKYPTERARFIEDVVANRPNPAFRMFTDTKEATEWLRRASRLRF